MIKTHRAGRKPRWLTVVALTGLALVILIVLIVLLIRYPQKVETERLITSGLEMLSQAEQATVADAEQSIDQLLEAERKAEEEAKRQEESAAQAQEKPETLSNQEIRTIFKQSVFVGDSLTEAIEYYQFLPGSSVIYKRGMSVPNAGELFPSIVEQTPKQVFLSFGMNDLLYFNGDSAAFASAYQEKLQDLQGRLPNAEIFVTSILPLRPNAIEKKPAFTHCAEFNQALAAMCKENSVTFIDCTALAEAHTDLYEPDGIHVKSTFYPYWFAEVADQAGLLP